MENNNTKPDANLVRKLMNNSWSQPPVSRQQAEQIIEKIIKEKTSIHYDDTAY